MNGSEGGNGGAKVRRFHRRVSIAFTVTVIACFAAIGQAESAPWVFHLPLPPLVLLLFTGLYLFSLPHTRKWRAGRGAVRPE
ncbi:hypothetical protein [Saccharothrix yanglingensis]|uniref:Transmembrane protein n=1 Tax=Saccharothrix yanglingensis TaxID=659496 RepID=A0ABU0X880_9PSEU|nr:hypothetical protein [Saccharothrix yanglingensis]MDQ2588340.1 hypothetical protein [Saccharothrix yanglingensis]